MIDLKEDLWRSKCNWTFEISEYIVVANKHFHELPLSFFFSSPKKLKKKKKTKQKQSIRLLIALIWNLLGTFLKHLAHLPFKPKIETAFLSKITRLSHFLVLNLLLHGSVIWRFNNRIGSINSFSFFCLLVQLHIKKFEQNKRWSLLCYNGEQIKFFA